MLAADSAASWVFGLVFLLVVVGLMLRMVRRSFAKTAASFRGQNRCAFCGARLKVIGTSIAPACSKCGRVQPWAQAQSKEGPRTEKPGATTTSA